MHTLKRIIIAGLLFALPAICSTVDQVYADVPVVDFSNLEQNILTAARTATQIENQLQMINNQVRSLSTLPNGSSGPVKSIYASNTQELNSTISSVQGISFDLNQIESQFNQLYPSRQWSNVNSAQYGQMMQNWNRQLTDAAKTAMKLQSSVQRSQAYNNEAAAILDRSASADGEVRQLQSNTQMLGLVSTQLNGLTENLAASSRITATAAAEDAQRKEAAAAFDAKMLRGSGHQDITDHGVTLP